jgi:hypothetical protein
MDNDVNHKKYRIFTANFYEKDTLTADNQCQQHKLQEHGTNDY